MTVIVIIYVSIPNKMNWITSIPVRILYTFFFISGTVRGDGIRMFGTLTKTRLNYSCHHKHYKSLNGLLF